jgi:transposase
LNNSFQPPSKIRILRTYWRQRLQHVTGAATCVQRMQKALTQMNIQLTNVISDLSGVTGQLIVRAKKKKKQNKNNPHFHLADELQRITGVDLTRIDGIDVIVAQTVISEVGLDMSPWKTEAHFASWLGVCPDNRISGDKVLARGTRHVLNRAATALRLGASTLLKSQTYLGAQYRRLRSKLGAPKAITAMGHRLARLVYRMLKYGQQYIDKGAEYYEQRNRQQQIEFVRKKAAQLGLQVTPTHV